MIIYIVNMIRYGNFDQHSYIVGSYSSKEKAIEIGKQEEIYRGGKYECYIYESIVDGKYKYFKLKYEEKSLSL